MTNHPNRGKARQIKRIYVRRYTDNGQTVAYVDWADGSHTEGALKYSANPRRALLSEASFGTHMHALFARAKRDGLRLERETW